MAGMARVDGQPVHPSVATALQHLGSAFRAATGQGLIVSSGYRSHKEQIAFFLSRYRVQASGNGPYGDVRWWRGRRYVRVSGEGTVSVPGASLHESYRAIDIRDTGADAGVTTKGTKRSNWIRDNARRYQFNPNGLNFGEPWHIEYTGSLAALSGDTFTPIIEQERHMKCIYMQDKYGVDRYATIGPNGPVETDPATSTAERKLWGLQNVSQDEWNLVFAAANARKAALTAVAIDYTKLAAAMKGATTAPTAAEVAAETIRQMKLPGN